jgi:ORF6N domain
MKPDKVLIPIERIAQQILMVRGKRVMLDRELAALYGVTTGNLNKAVARNGGRFPDDFMFRLTQEEAQTCFGSRFQIGILKRGKNIKYLPFAFTEQGVAMLSSVLRSERAVRVNIAIMRAFVKLSEVLATNRELAHQFAELERHVGRLDGQLNAIMQAIRKLMTPRKQPRREIGFHVRDATSDKTPQARRR